MEMDSGKTEHKVETDPVNYMPVLYKQYRQVCQIRSVLNKETDQSRCVRSRDQHMDRWMKNARQSKCKFKDLFIVFFFDNKGIIMEKWVPDEVTVDQHYYTNRRRPQLCLGK